MDPREASSTPEPDPELENKIREDEERIAELEAQLEEVQSDSERASIENQKMEAEVSSLRTLKSELQANIDSMMIDFKMWQEKLTEAEEITNKVPSKRTYFNV